jgi:aminopeptidase N
MNKHYLFILFLVSQTIFAQFKETTTLHWDLIHTELRLKPNFSNQTIEGTAIITIKPYFYSQNTVHLNARSFIISEVKLDNKNLTYKYEEDIIKISFDRSYQPSDTLKIYIKYIAQPEKIVSNGSDAITSDKGLYFINHDDTEDNLPRQFWTQGETQANSGWFPTFDTPNQNHTQDIFLTVEKKMTTLSNGLLVDSKEHNDGTKTDHWQLKSPHAVYLSMIAAGNFSKVVDSTYKKFEVSYYVEPEFEKSAYGIFGRTPEMIDYFENLLGVPYKWPKYAQMPVRKYVSGAMENTSATIHSKSVLKNENQLIDGNDDAVIAHELFHHWFGNLVTCESWSHLPLNESFANYAEYLWSAHKYGQDEADFANYQALGEYFQESMQKQVSMVRFNYNNREDMFDAHSYQKGGRILHQIRMEIGDEAFFKSLNYYLNTHAWQTVEIEDLRQAFEKVTGRDLRKIFEQWFYYPGHPRLIIDHKISGKKIEVNIKQVSDSLNSLIYSLKFPLKIYTSKGAIDTVINLTDLEQKFSFEAKNEIQAFLPNPHIHALAMMVQNANLKELMFIYDNSDRAITRMFALEKIQALIDEEPEKYNLKNKEIRGLYIKALKDTFWKIRDWAVHKFMDYDGDDFLIIEKALQNIIKNDPKSNVRADALLAVKNFLNPQNDILFRNALTDTSNLVKSAALEALFVNKVPDADVLVEKYKDINDFNIFMSVGSYLSDFVVPESQDWYLKKIKGFESFEKYQSIAVWGAYLAKSDDEIIRKSLDIIKNLSLNETEWYVKYASTQVAYMLSEMSSEAEVLLNLILKTEKDPRLKEYYAQFKK